MGLNQDGDEGDEGGKGKAKGVGEGEGEIYRGMLAGNFKIEITTIKNYHFLG